MAIAGKVRGPARLALLRAHRLIVLDKVFDEYCQGRANCDDVRVRALKLKQIKKK